MKNETFVVHPPEVEMAPDNRALVAPIYQSVKFEFDDVDEVSKNSRGERPGFQYSRVSNPTLQQLELTLSALQGRDACLVTASGVAAVNLALLSLCKQGDHVVLFAEAYQPTRMMIRRILARFGVRHTMLSIEDIAGLERVLKETPTRLIMFESPTNPILKIADLPKITALAREHGALTVLDNTFAGFHNHGQFDIDVFVHSLTKYASGHGDVMGGAVIARQELINGMRPDFITIGAILDPHACFLIQRGMKTYFLRYERQCANALAIAQFLESNPAVEQVRYPGLPSHPQHALAKSQLKDFGSVVTFELKGGLPAAKKFAESLTLFATVSSLGSTDSLVLPPQHLAPSGMNAEERRWSGITDQTVRLSVGIEAVDDLIEDLAQAFSRSA
ncbi:MAG: aminotransferase class I/II-fold pyridoxal phosphate-dependent enzyme [Steroidobacteraceae bacterium]